MTGPNLFSAHPWRGVRPFERHSLVLFVAGAVYILIGVSYIFAPPTQARAQALHYALAWWSMNVWGAIFVMAGLLAIISARWPPVSKTWGYIVLTGLAAGWSAFYLVGVIFGHAAKSNLSAVMSWGLIAFLWWAISGLVNPARKV